MAATYGRNDPLASFNFVVDIQGMRAGFTEVSGLETETDVIEYREGTEEIAKRKLTGIRKYTNITLKRGYTNSQELWNWSREVIEGKSRRLPGTITLLDEGRNAAAVWKFDNGWPMKLEGPAFDAKSNDIAIEVLELAVEGLHLDYPPDRN